MKSIFVDPERCVACRTCEIACAVTRSSLSKALPGAMYEETPPLSRVRVESAGPDRGFPVQCRHCEDAPCLDACPAGALYRHQDGLVLLHEARCIGCWMCVMVCPFGAPKPFRHVRKMLKCDQCHGMEAVACVESCPTGALLLLDPHDVGAGTAAPLARRPSLVGLNFVALQERRESD